MVQTITINETTLAECMAKFVSEDLNFLNGETSWWHQRVRLVEHWLRDETSGFILPRDGTEEMIRRHIQRGDSHPQAQCKCWTYIVLELRDLAFFAEIDRQPRIRDEIALSPSRGKLRPGKDLIILDDEKCTDSSSKARNLGDHKVISNAASPWSLERLNIDSEHAVVSKRPRPLSSAGYMSRQVLCTEIPAVGKTFAEMSLLERQMEWLQKKHEHRETERLRQAEENERELTFQPKLIRRITYSVENYFRESPIASSNGRFCTQSESSRHVEETKRIVLKERTLPQVPRLSHRRRSQKKTPLQLASQFQPVQVPCKLLDSMKLELQASVESSQISEIEFEDNIAACSSLDGMQLREGNDEEPHVLEATAEEMKPEGSVPAWSVKPNIGGRCANVDSSETRVRLTLQDAAKFELSSMYRKTDRKAGRDGVALHVGRREDTLEEQVIAVLFDREKVTEDEAERWWANHQHRFIDFIKPQQRRDDERKVLI